MLQMEWASSNKNQFWLDPSKIMASTTKIYPSPTDLVPIWQQEIGKFLESEFLNNSESPIKSDSNAKIGVSSDNRGKKLESALQKILDYKKERDISEHLIREFGDNANTKKNVKFNV